MHNLLHTQIINFSKIWRIAYLVYVVVYLSLTLGVVLLHDNDYNNNVQDKHAD